MTVRGTDSRLARDLTAGYSQAWQRIRAELDKLLDDIQAARARGETIDPAWLHRRNRLQALERQTLAAIRTYVDLAQRKITRAQADAYLQGAIDAETLLKRSLPPGLGWTPPLPAAQVAEIAAAMRTGAPLGLLLDRLGEDAARAAKETLLTGVVLGHGPRQVAREMRRTVGITLRRALTIARTEIIGAYRRAAHTRYREPTTARLLQGWTWVARLDGRTCPVCIAQHGSFHQLDESMNSHPNCRCVPVPKTVSWAELGFPDVEETSPVFEPGSDWFARQTPAFQRKTLGPGKFSLYQQGDLRLEDLVQPVVNPIWGPGLKERPLRELQVVTR